MAVTYILQCKDNRYYIGSSLDINKRLTEHMTGKCKFTKSRLPVELIYTEEFVTYAEARKREYQIKNWKSRLAIENLIKSRLQGPIV